MCVEYRHFPLCYSELLHFVLSTDTFPCVTFSRSHFLCVLITDTFPCVILSYSHYLYVLSTDTFPGVTLSRPLVLCLSGTNTLPCKTLELLTLPLCSRIQSVLASVTIVQLNLHFKSKVINWSAKIEITEWKVKGQFKVTKRSICLNL